MGTSLLWQTDSQLHDSVQRELGWAPDVDAAGVAVIARDGVVTLTGFVDSYWQKVRGRSGCQARPHASERWRTMSISGCRERTDPDIAHDAVLALKRWPSVPRTVIVTVRDGFVTLEGCVAVERPASGCGIGNQPSRRRQGRVERHHDPGRSPRSTESGRPSSGRWCRLVVFVRAHVGSDSRATSSSR